MTPKCPDCKHDQDDCSCSETIESLRQQLNACRQLKQAYIEELADMQKREVMLRIKLVKAADFIQPYNIAADLLEELDEALAATEPKP